MRYRLLLIVSTLSALLLAQAPPRNRLLGVVVSTNANGAVVKTDAGESIPVAFLPETKLRKVAPGEKDLSKASDIQVSGLAAGDRVLIRGTAGEAGAAIVAQSVIVMSGGDIARKQQKDRMEWQRNGFSGLVVSTNPAAKEVTIRIPSLMGGEARTATIALTDKTLIRRYTPDSVRFADAKPSAFEQIAAGDQLKARGTKSEDGARLTAEEVVTGAFRTIAGTVTAVNAAANELTVTEVGTAKPLTIKVTPDSNLRRLAFPGAMGAAPGAVPGGPRSGGMVGGGGRPDFSQMLERMPHTTLAELTPGDTIVVSSTKGVAEDKLTAITLLSNAANLVAMHQTRQQNGGQRQGNGAGAMGGNWNLGDMSSMAMQ